MAHIKLTYTLSNKQTKELQRGTRLKIALPMEPCINFTSTPSDYLNFAAERLTLPDSVSVAEWEVQDQFVSPARNPQNVGLSALLGDIMLRIENGTIAYLMPCLVVTIGTDRHNGTTHPPKWPGGETIREVVK